MEDMADLSALDALEYAERSADLDAIIYGNDDDYEGF